MPTSNQLPLSVETILGAVERHGLTLGACDWKVAERCCAGGAYAIACDPRLAREHEFGWETILWATSLDHLGLQGLSDGFEGVPCWWPVWLTSRSYRHAYRVGRAVYAASWSMERAAGPSIPPPPHGRPDDREPIAERTQTESLLARVRALEIPPQPGIPATAALTMARLEVEAMATAVGADDFDLDDHYRMYPGGG